MNKMEQQSITNRENMGEQSRKKVIREYEISHIVDQLETLYDKMLLRYSLRNGKKSNP